MHFEGTYSRPYYAAVAAAMPPKPAGKGGKDDKKPEVVYSEVNVCWKRDKEAEEAKGKADEIDEDTKKKLTAQWDELSNRTTRYSYTFMFISIIYILGLYARVDMFTLDYTVGRRLTGCNIAVLFIKSISPNDFVR